MKNLSAWAQVACAALVPIIIAIVVMYSDIQSLKMTKAEQTAVLELKIYFTEQMTRNTVAIENLNETLKKIGGINGKE